MEPALLSFSLPAGVATDSSVSTYGSHPLWRKGGLGEVMKGRGVSECGGRECERECVCV